MKTGNFWYSRGNEKGEWNIMIMQLLGMCKHIENPTAEGYYKMGEVLTNFHLLSPKKKKETCYQLLTFPNRSKEGLKVVDYLLESSEYRRDFPTWGHDKGLYILYASKKNKTLEKQYV